MKPNAYKCDICGSTAINHTQLDCNWNKQTTSQLDLVKTEPAESKQIEFESLDNIDSDTKVFEYLDLLARNQQKIIDHLQKG